MWNPNSCAFLVTFGTQALSSRLMSPADKSVRFTGSFSFSFLSLGATLSHPRSTAYAIALLNATRSRLIVRAETPCALRRFLGHAVWPNPVDSNASQMFGPTVKCLNLVLACS